MNSSELLKLYLCSNALLLASYLVFASLRKLTTVFKWNASPRQLIVVGQALIAISVFAPILLHSIPRQHLPTFEWSSFRPLPEGDPSTFRQRNASLTQAAPDLLAVSDVGSENSWITRALQWTAGPSWFSVTTFFLVLLLVGSTFFSIRLLRSIFQLRRLLRDATSIRSLGRVRIVVSDAITVPFSVRMDRKSWVVLPTQILQQAGDFRLALRHELQHHRQGDTAWAILIEFLVCFFFINPAIFLWKMEMIELQEFSCDEALIGHKGISSHEYGSCLVRVAETALGARRMLVGTTGMAAASRNPFYYKSLLRRRIEMFTSHKRPHAVRWAGALTCTAMGTVTMMFTMAVAYGANLVMHGQELGVVNPGVAVVDPAIQQIAETTLGEAIQAQRAKGGFAIVADPRTGKILAIANIDTTGKLSGRWSLGQVLEPASLAKTLVIAQAIESKLTTPQTSHACENGNYRFGDRVYHDWKTNGWDYLTTEDTIAFSGDICTIKIAEKIGADGLVQMLKDFGFGPEGTAATFPEARPGVLPPGDQAHFNSPYKDTIPSVSAGFGFGTTPIELMQAYGAIANGGNLMKPVQANASESETRVIRRVLSPESAKQMRAILQQVVLKGTAKDRASSDLYSTAGKTATSYVPDLKKWNIIEGKKDGNFAGFIGFAPVQEPRVEVYVGIRDPNTGRTGAHGSAHAAPVFKQIVERVLQHLKVAPTSPSQSADPL